MLQSLDVAKSVGDDRISPRILKSCAQSLCGLLIALFHMICTYSDFLEDQLYFSRIYIKNCSRTDPTCYRPIAVLPTLSRVFERLLVPQLSRCIHSHILKEQFRFMKSSSTSDAGTSDAVTAGILQGAIWSPL